MKIYILANYDGVILGVYLKLEKAKSRITMSNPEGWRWQDDRWTYGGYQIREFTIE